jgi:drug/metabolite transporter (DMT)-like permease
MSVKFDVPGHVYILLTLVFTVYGQLVLKWQMGQAGPMPEAAPDKLLFLLQQFFKPWILSGFASAFLASLAWMAAMTRLDLNYAYPFMSLAFVIVLGFAILFLDEPLSAQRILGTLLVVSGLIVITR